jgi:hypothetical protein
MRKFAGLLVVAIAMAGVGAAPTAAAGDEKTYWIGQGEARGSSIDFVISRGKVRELETFSGKTKCSEGSKVNMGRGWDPIKLSDNAFEERVNTGSPSFVAGHIRGSKASGRIRHKTVWREDEFCDSGFIGWKADQVTREEWQDAHSTGR